MSDYTPTTDEWRENAKWGCYGVTTDYASAEFDRWLAAHDAEVAAKALINMALTLEIPRFISSYNQEPPMQRMTNAEIVDALRARAAEYRKSVES